MVIRSSNEECGKSQNESDVSMCSEQCGVKYSRIIVISESFGKGVVINFQLCDLKQKKK